MFNLAEHRPWYIYPASTADMQKTPEFGVFPFLIKVTMQLLVVPMHGKLSEIMTTFLDIRSAKSCHVTKSLTPLGGIGV